MSEQTSVDPRKHVAIKEAAARFGYLHIRYFRTRVASAFGLTTLKIHGRWYLLRTEVEEWLARYREVSTKIETALSE